jgi:peptide/nickel transport system substrate-binding protein
VSKQPLSYAGYANTDFDKAITQSRETNDAAQRRKLFEEAAKMEHRDRPIVYLYHRQWLWAHTNRLQGFSPVPDGMVRLQNLKMN